MHCSQISQEYHRKVEEPYGYKLKGVGEMKFHLGCDYYRDPDGVLRSGPKGYIDKMVEGFKMMFPGEQPDKGKKVPFLNFNWDQASNNQGSNHKMVERGAQMKNPRSIAVQVEGECQYLTSPKPSQDLTGPKPS